MAGPARLEDLTDVELDALFRALASQPQPATLSGVEQPEPPPEPEPLAPRLPQSWQGLPDRPSQEMVARPLMPQTAQEAEDQLAANQRYRALHEGAQTAMMVAAPVGRALQLGGAVVRGAGNLVGNLVTRSPVARGVATTGAVATGLTAASGQTQQADPVTAQMGKIAEAEREQATIRQRAREREQALAAFQKEYGNISRSSRREDVERLQRFLSSPAGGSRYSMRIDGRWSDGTQAALDAHLKAIEDAKKADTTTLGTLDTTLGRLNTEMRSLRGDARLREHENSWSRFIADNIGWAGLGAGAVTGWGLRAYLASRANRLRAQAMTDANTMIVPQAGDTLAGVNSRVTGANLFFRGGGGAEPYVVAPQARMGFRPAQGQTTGADLYQPPGRMTLGGQWTGQDWASVLVGGAAGYGADLRLGRVQSQYDKALADFRDDPSAANTRLLMNAEIELAATKFGARAVQGSPLGYISAARRFRYTYPRPDLQRAGTEVLNLNALLRGTPQVGRPPGGPLAGRERWPAGTRGPNGEALGGRLKGGD